MADGELLAALASSQRLGFLGARPVAEVVEHAMAFVEALADVSGTVVDIGTGGGVPGLVIAVHRPDLRLLLVDRRASRTDHVARLVRRLGLGDRVAVTTADVMTLALPSPADAVVARGFGPPAATATAAARLLGPGGRLVVSEPPEADPARWPAGMLDSAGLVPAVSPDARVAVFRRVPRETPAAGDREVSRET